MKHTSHMQQALSLGRRTLGQTWPNPAVGAVVVKDEKIIGEGWTGRGGRPHAETQALNAAGAQAKGATLYVTLEPCAHHGQTPPCTEAIIAAGIAACVVACRDPHSEVNGKGIAQLRAAGIEVIEHICAEEARQSHEGFFSCVQKQRPFVALKIATSQDDKITTGIPGRRWITGEAARAQVHRLRSETDAILTGIGTVLADDPLLTCRLPGFEDRSPVRVILDRHHRLPVDSQIARTQDKVITWVLDRADISTVLSHLAQQGITRVLVEAGRALNTEFLESGVVDRVYWFKSPDMIGEQGLPAVSGDLTALLHASGLRLTTTEPYAPDVLACYAR